MDFDERQKHITFLFDHKFPEYNSRVINGTVSGRSLADPKIRRRLEEAREYRKHLDALSVEKLAEMVVEARQAAVRAASAKAEAEEKARSFNKEAARIDLEHWARASFWSREESVALLLDRDPRKVDWDTVKPYAGISPFARKYADLRDLIWRAYDMGQFHLKSTPTFVLGWAERMQIEAPDSLREKVESMGQMIGDWHKIATLQQTKIAEMEAKSQEDAGSIQALSARIAELEKKLVETEERQKLESPLTKPENPTAIERTKTSLQKMVIGMAIRGYAHDPSAGRTTTASEIAGDLQLVGLSLDEDTIRNHLRQAAEHLPVNRL